MAYENRQFLQCISKARCSKVNNLTSHCVDEATDGDTRMFLQEACTQARWMTEHELGIRAEQPDYYEYFITDPLGRWKRYGKMALREQIVANLEILEDEILYGVRYINHLAWDESLHERIEELNGGRAAGPPVDPEDTELPS